MKKKKEQPKKSTKTKADKESCTSCNFIGVILVTT